MPEDVLLVPADGFELLRRLEIRPAPAPHSPPAQHPHPAGRPAPPHPADDMRGSGATTGVDRADSVTAAGAATVRTGTAATRARWDVRPGMSGCDAETRRHLRTIIGATFDVLGGRRREAVLTKLPLGRRVLGGLRTRLRRAKPTGVVLRTLHATERGDRARFVGTWQHGDRVRALAGSAERDSAGGAWGGWTVVSLRLL